MRRLPRCYRTGSPEAGKSTLIKILTGVETADTGTTRLDGVERRITDRRSSIDAGIEAVYQNLGLVDTLPAPANVLLGDEPARKILGFPFIDNRRMRVETERILRERVGVRLPNLDAPVQARAVPFWLTMMGAGWGGCCHPKPGGLCCRARGKSLSLRTGSLSRQAGSGSDPGSCVATPRAMLAQRVWWTPLDMGQVARPALPLHFPARAARAGLAQRGSARCALCGDALLVWSRGGRVPH